MTTTTTVVPQPQRPLTISQEDVGQLSKTAQSAAQAAKEATDVMQAKSSIVNLKNKEQELQQKSLRSSML